MLDDTSFAYTVPAEDRGQPSLEGLLAFCESRPADEMYNYYCVGKCLAHEYFATLGITYGRSNGGMDIPAVNRNGTVFERIEYVGADLPWTYGAAASRCRTLLAGRAS